MTIESRYLSAAFVGMLAAYGLTWLGTGNPLSYYVKLLCAAIESCERGLLRSALPVARLVRHNVREEWAKLRPERLAMEGE